MKNENRVNLAAQPLQQGVTSDPYVWIERHQQVIETNKERNPRLILIGDSITHYMGGVPDQDPKRGQDTWNTLFEPYRAVNMGFGFDRTDHVLWRITHGELDGISPEGVILMIGTNNMRPYSEEDTAEAIQKILDIIHEKLPAAKILLVGVLPHLSDEEPNRQGRIDHLNSMLAKLDGYADGKVRFTNAGRDIFLPADGKFRSDYCCDGTLHPNAEGYRQLGAALRPLIDGWLMKP